MSRRYARALLAIGIDHGDFDRLGEQLQAVVDLMQQHPALWRVLTSRSYAAPRRKRIVRDLAARLGLSAAVRNFLLLLIDRNRIELLPDISRAYADLADEHAGRTRAQVTSATPLDEATTSRLTQALEQRTGRRVILSVETDSALIAGLATRIGSVVIDGTARARLRQMGQSLLEGKQ